MKFPTTSCRDYSPRLRLVSPTGKTKWRFCGITPFAEEELLEVTVDFLQRAHGLDLEFSPRDGIQILRFALKRLAQESDHPVAADVVWREALERVLGAEALDLDALAAERDRSLGGVLPSMDLQDFFFDGDDPLHPGREDDPPTS